MEFSDALDNLLGYEKGYANVDGDRGGETYAGIARNYHPDWEGWSIIDNMKVVDKKFKKLLRENDELNGLVVEFYKKNYWDKFNGDKLPFVVANELLEQSVNLGTWKTAGINLQKGLNLLNRNGKLFKDLVVDGYVGKTTLKAVAKVKPNRLLRVLNGLQFMRYYKLDISNSENEKFTGWFDRV